MLLSTKVLYVSPNGTDSLAQKGNAAAPWNTAAGAESAAVSGDLIIVAPGAYSAFTPSKAGVQWFLFPGVSGIVSTQQVSGGAQLYEYTTTDPTADGVVPANLNSPAMAYKRDGTGPSFNWDTVAHVWR